MAEPAVTCTHHFNCFPIAIHSHDDHLSPTTGKFLKLEKEEESEREKSRKTERCPINPMSET